MPVLLPYQIMIVTLPLWLLILICVLALPSVLAIGIVVGYCLIVICFEIADLFTSGDPTHNQ